MNQRIRIGGTVRLTVRAKRSLAPLSFDIEARGIVLDFRGSRLLVNFRGRDRLSEINSKLVTLDRPRGAPEMNKKSHIKKKADYPTKPRDNWTACGQFVSEGFIASPGERPSCGSCGPAFEKRSRLLEESRKRLVESSKKKA